MADTSREEIEKLLQMMKWQIDGSEADYADILVDGFILDDDVIVHAMRMLRALRAQLSAAEAEVERLKAETPEQIKARADKLTSWW